MDILHLPLAFFTNTTFSNHSGLDFPYVVNIQKLMGFFPKDKALILVELSPTLDHWPNLFIHGKPTA